MSGSNAVGRIFNEAYQKIAKGRSIPLKDIKLAAGQMTSFKNEEGIRYIVVGTRFGVVGFRDGEPDQSDDGYYVKFIPDSKLLEAILPSKTSFVSTAEAAVIVGPWGKMGNNIGFIVEDIIEELKEELAK